ncbi:hypothetical protein N182_35865 [Sinorhizobium sp. GL2]|nr:hypothetical protein N182_35865 [Sinorhizobium sp. GL2]
MPIVLLPSRSMFCVFPTDKIIFFVLIGFGPVALPNGLDPPCVNLTRRQAVAGFAVQERTLLVSVIARLVQPGR